jgi:hypothetical protein
MSSTIERLIVEAKEKKVEPREYIADILWGVVNLSTIALAEKIMDCEIHGGRLGDGVETSDAMLRRWGDKGTEV